MDFLRDLRARLFGDDEQPTDDEQPAAEELASTDAPADEVATSPEDSLSPPVLGEDLTPPTPLSGAERGETPGDADPSGESDDAADASDDRIDPPLSAPERGPGGEVAPEAEGEANPQPEEEVIPQAEAETLPDVLDEVTPEAPDEVAPDARPFADAVPGRQERAASRILDDEGLRGDLTDDECQPLLDWALRQTDALAAATGALDDEQAKAAIEAGLVAIREALRAAQESHTAPTLGEETA